MTATAMSSREMRPEKTRTTSRSRSRHIHSGRLNRFFESVETNSAFQSIRTEMETSNRDASEGIDEVDAGTTANLHTLWTAWSSQPVHRRIHISDETLDLTGPASQRISWSQDEINLLLNAARIGCCAIIIDKVDVNLANDDGVTALHVAAEYGNYDDVEILLNNGAKIEPDRQGLTPLHEAASSTELDPRIAKLLTENMTDTLKNATVPETNRNKSTIGNTALHFAAENEHSTRKFIQELETLDPSIKNKLGETAFHIAARSENPDVIVSMLEVFTPTKAGWEMSSIERESKTATLLETCAKKGNAKAAALLIKYGANISANILFELIDESTMDPTKTEKLIDVYRTITECCVFWKWLMKNRHGTSSDRNQRYPRRRTEPEVYRERRREVMLELLNEPNDYYRNRNVLEYAIAKGDRVFLNEIVNTRDVFRIAENSNQVKYDITYFVDAPSDGSGLCGRKKVAPISVERPAPKQSYLRLMIENRHLWENTDILQREPFHTITEPICWFVRLLYFAMSLVQLIHMVFFSLCFMSSYCSVLHQRNLTTSNQCNSSSVPFEVSVVGISHVYKIMNFFWLPWPTAVFIATVVNRFQHKKWGQKCYGCLSSRLLFAPLLWMWYIKTFLVEEFNLSCTSVVFLFGWLLTLSLFIYLFEKASIFSFLLKEIIVKDIAFGFGIVFIFILVSFHRQFICYGSLHSLAIRTTLTHCTMCSLLP